MHLRLLPILVALAGFMVDISLATPPNIVWFMSDDLGYGELSSFGQTSFSTPRIDQLAAEGMKFTNAYAGSPVCAPR